MLKLAHESPPTPLRLLPDFTGVLPDKDEELRLRAGLLTTALDQWAKTDPLAAATWLRENGATFQIPITESTKCGILSGAATRDPALAFKLIDELGVEDKSEAVMTIARETHTAEERTSTLAALRTYLGTIADEKSRAEASEVGVREIVSGSLKEGFGPSTEWLALAKFNVSETNTFVSALGHFNTGSETGEWIGWLGKTLPADRMAGRVRKLIEHWSQADYQAAGQWLVAAPDSPAKNISIQAYAETVGKYDPATAIQWVMTLPPGKERDRTMLKIEEIR